MAYLGEQISALDAFRPCRRDSAEEMSFGRVSGDVVHIYDYRGRSLTSPLAVLSETPLAARELKGR